MEAVLMRLSILFIAAIFPMSLVAQSGQKNVQTKPLPSTNVAAARSKNDDDNLTRKKFQFVVSGNFNHYIEELNKLGKLRYRVDKAFNYGGDSSFSQTYVALVVLDPEETFEYDWLTSPNKKFLELRLNLKAERGFNPIEILPHTSCSNKETEDDTQPFPVGDLLLRLTKGDVFLLERRNGKAAKVKEYKVYSGKIGLGKNPTAELQSALDNSPSGFHPLKILFNKSGILDFAVSILLEKDLKNINTEKIEYRFFKDVNGFEKEINSLAKEGFQLVAGRRIGLVKFALLAKVPGNAVSYILLNADKYQKDLPKKVSPGNIYKGMFLGDTSCDEPETKGAKLVFAQTVDSGLKYEHKFLRVADKALFPAEASLIAELDRLRNENYIIGDVFYSDGPTVIMEKLIP